MNRLLAEVSPSVALGPPASAHLLSATPCPAAGAAWGAPEEQGHMAGYWKAFVYLELKSAATQNHAYLIQEARDRPRFCGCSPLWVSNLAIL